MPRSNDGVRSHIIFVHQGTTNVRGGFHTPHMLSHFVHRFIALSACALATVAGARAQASLEARLQALEETVHALQKENADLRRDLGVSGTSGMIVVKPSGKEPVLAINGLVQAQAEFGDKGDSRGNANDRFRLRRVRLGASGRFLEEFDFKVEGEYVGSSVTLTDGFLNWSHFDWANIKAGQFKTPFGYEFLASDPKLYTIERTLGSDRLTLNRQIGVQASGNFFEKRLSYAAGVFNGNGANVTTNDNDQFLYVGRLAGTPWQGKLFGQSAKWTAGIDGYASRDTAVTMGSDFGLTGNSFAGRREAWGVDTQFTLGRFALWTEYLRVRFDPTNDKPAPAFAADAWYVQASCFLIPNRLQAVVKFDTFDPNNKKSANETDAWTFGANWFLKGDDLKLQCDYVRTDAPATASAQDQLWLRAQVIF